ncbi:hypothetical protein HK107_04860 [Parvularcula sp. ZS-1/3]|uniref:DUF2946 domain-containing protein n=1 Tax=Parvularcula mediterranea TaxID=2732508 RepID=A0A7Y3RKE7_9PROT|nr:hypothetical protein [Parvularcula mediterranea]NNU15646.1 hypothetical protein [Parvularcula mediterranea]
MNAIRRIALLAAVLVGLTGGELRLSFTPETPMVTLCSGGHVTEVPFDLGEEPEEEILELCCGDCVPAVTEALLRSAVSLPKRVFRSETRLPPSARRAFIDWSWRAPPSRAPPAIV